jgi:hypothetical protein
MADGDQGTGDQGQGNPGTGDNPEDKFWKRFHGELDNWFAKKSKETTPSTSRQSPGGSVSGFLADLMGGPFKPSDKK